MKRTTKYQLGYFEELTTNYLRHPAYAEYPVVGVNWLQAVQFAEWRTDRVNEFILEREAYIEKDVRYTEIDANSTFSTSAYLKVPETTYGGKIDSLVGKNGRQKRDTTEVNVYAGVDFKLRNAKQSAKLICSGINIFDIAYQSNLSRLKYTARNNATDRNGVFNMGRNISFTFVYNF